MTDWAAEGKGVYEDLKAEGFEITVRVEGPEGEWDDDLKSYFDAGADADYTTYGTKKAYSVRDINGTTVQQDDTRLIFPAYGLDETGTLGPLPALATTNKILIGGVEQNVVDLNPVDPGNVPIMYEAQVRK